MMVTTVLLPPSPASASLTPPAAAAVSPVVASALGSAAVDPTCPNVMVIGARGSGEVADPPPSGMGREVTAFYDGLNARVNGKLTLDFRHVRYTAAPVAVLWPTPAEQARISAALNTPALLAVEADIASTYKAGHLDLFTASINEGIATAFDELTIQAARCPSARFVLAGYSQGAMVMHQLLLRLSDNQDVGLLGRIADTVLIADGDKKKATAAITFGTAGRNAQGVRSFFSTGERDIPSGKASSTYDICDNNDIVCDFKLASIGKFQLASDIHSSYKNGFLGRIGALVGAHLLTTAFVTTTSLPAGQVGVPYTGTLAGTGVGTLKWSAVTALPAGLALSARGRVTGTPTTSGTGSFVVRLTDGARHTAVGTISMTINPGSSALTVTTTTLPAAVVTQPYTATLTATGGAAPLTWSIASGSLPLGLSLSASGSISGTPTTLGSASFTAAVSDSSGAATTAALTLDVIAGPPPSGTMQRVSVASDGTEGDNNSNAPSVSADGRYVAFGSAAANLVPGDTNGATDVFVHDRVTGATERVSVASDGTEGTRGNNQPTLNSSDAPSISADGRYVAFESVAPNLVPGDTNGEADVSVHDRVTGATTRVSVASDGTEAVGESTFPVLVAPSISADGRYVAFESAASNLVPGDTNGEADVFVHDRVTGATTRVSVASDGTEATGGYFIVPNAPAISADGRYISFDTAASNLVPGDTNGMTDVFVHDRVTGATTRVSVASDGTQGDFHSDAPSISSDGRYIAFETGASNLGSTVAGNSNVLVHDRVTGVTSNASIASIVNGFPFADCRGPSISADGRYVSFTSFTELNNGTGDHAADVVVYDRTTGASSRIATSVEGAGTHIGGRPVTSADGGQVAFQSWATGLVPADNNNNSDVFVFSR